MSSIRPNKFSAVILVENSIVKVLNMEIEGISFGHFAPADKSSICVEKMKLSENNFTAMLFRVKESDVTLYEIKFYCNKVEVLLHTIQLNNVAFIRNRFLRIKGNSSAII